MRSFTNPLVAAPCLGTVAAVPATREVGPAAGDAHHAGHAGAHQDLDRLDPMRYAYEDAIVEWVQAGPDVAGRALPRRG